MTATKKLSLGMATLARYTARCFFHITHSGFALLGLAMVFSAIALVARPELREAAEVQLMSWLQDRQINGPEPISATTSPTEPAQTVSLSNLPKPQAAIAVWLSKKYSVAPEPLGALVAEAYAVGERTKLDPTLILAVMAVESGFNPFAQSHVGAQGLMQVMTQIHSEKYQGFGGKMAAFDPVANLRVGVKVLQECIRRGGSVEGGLRLYVGAGNLDDDGGYSAKVLAEQSRLQQVASGKAVPMFPTTVAPTPPPAPAATPSVPAEPETTADLSKPYVLG
jgi:soluble lytic murein transglycosylase-like protein